MNPLKEIMLVKRLWKFFNEKAWESKNDEIEKRKITIEMKLVLVVQMYDYLFVSYKPYELNFPDFCGSIRWK